MSKGWQIYYSTIFGAIGGLLAWLFVGMVPTSQWNIHMANLFVGAGVGLFIGGALGAVEGLVVKRSWRPTVKGVLAGGFVGFFSGMFGLLLGGVAFLVLEGGLIGRMTGWMALGLFLGLGQGVISLKTRRATYGLVGGTLAGLVGGALYEIFTHTFLEQSSQAQVYLSALGLILIGMSLGSIIPISVALIGRIFSDRGLVVVLTGRRANMEVEVIGSASLGSSDACDVYLPDDRVEKQQAEIRRSQQGFEIQNTGQTTAFQVGQSLLYPGQSMALTGNDQLLMGSTQLSFRAR